jgi:hypothetical protein
MPDPHEDIVMIDGVAHVRARTVATVQMCEEGELSPQLQATTLAVASQMWEVDDASADLVNVRFLLDSEGPNLNWD